MEHLSATPRSESDWCRCLSLLQQNLRSEDCTLYTGPSLFTPDPDIIFDVSRGPHDTTESASPDLNAYGAVPGCESFFARCEFHPNMAPRGPVSGTVCFESHHIRVLAIACIRPAHMLLQPTLALVTIFHHRAHHCTHIPLFLSPLASIFRVKAFPDIVLITFTSSQDVRFRSRCPAE